MNKNSDPVQNFFLRLASENSAPTQFFSKFQKLSKTSGANIILLKNRPSNARVIVENKVAPFSRHGVYTPCLKKRVNCVLALCLLQMNLQTLLAKGTVVSLRLVKFTVMSWLGLVIGQMNNDLHFFVAVFDFIYIGNATQP